MLKKEKDTSSSTLPSSITAAEPEELMKRLAEGRDYAGALSLAHIIGESVARKSAPDLLNKLRQRLKYGVLGNAADGPIMLAWAEVLMGWDADAFEFKGNPLETSGSVPYQGSFFESLMSGGFWSYASKLALASPKTKKNAKLAIARLNLTSSPDRWHHIGRQELRPGTLVQELMIGGGELGLALGFALDLDPNGIVKNRPWVFACQDAASIRAFTKAGFDASAKNELGLSLPEACSRIPLARMRQEMQKAAVDACDAHEKLKSSKDSESKTASVVRDPASHIYALAPRAGWREIERASKAVGVDPLVLLDKDGNTMLALAVQSSNWALASELLKAGADPLQITGSPPLPVALRALGADSQMSMNRKYLPVIKRQALEKLELEMIDKVNFSWRDDQGRAPLEAFAAAYPGREPGGKAFDQWIKVEPINPENPLWARVARCGFSPSTIARAASRDKEPWLTQNFGLLELLASEIPYNSFMNTMNYGVALTYFMTKMGHGASAAPQMSKLCTAAQWEKAIDALWRVERVGARDTAKAIRNNLLAAMKLWNTVAMAAEIQVFDIKSMGQALVAGLKNDFTGLPCSVETTESISKISVGLCLLRPFEAGAIVLDVLTSGHPQAIEIAYAIWTEGKGSEANLRMPKSHPIFETPGAVSEKLANHPMWREIEAESFARASKGSAKMRL